MTFLVGVVVLAGGFTGAPLEPGLAALCAGQLAQAEQVVAEFWGTAAPVPDVYVCASREEFRARTGLPAWHGAAFRRGAIVLQPARLLAVRGLVRSCLIHELVHARLAGCGVPRWLEEGLGVYLSGSGERFASVSDVPAGVEEIERCLVSSRPEEVERGYGAAYRRLVRLLAEEGTAGVRRMIERRQ